MVCGSTPHFSVSHERRLYCLDMLGFLDPFTQRTTCCLFSPVVNNHMHMLSLQVSSQVSRVKSLGAHRWITCLEYDQLCKTTKLSAKVTPETAAPAEITNVRGLSTFSHPSKCWQSSHHCFNLEFPNDKWKICVLPSTRLSCWVICSVLSCGLDHRLYYLWS